MKHALVVGDAAACARFSAIAAPGDGLRVSGCASAAEAWELLVAERPDLLVIASGGAQGLEELLDRATRHFSEGDLSKVAWLDAEEAALEARVDVVVCDGVPEDAIIEIASAPRRARTIDPALLARLTILQEDDDALRRAIAVVCSAFGSPGGALVLETPRSVSLAGAWMRGADEEVVARRLLRASETGLLVAPASGESEGAFECWQALPIVGAAGRRVGAVGLVDAVTGSIDPARRRALAAVASRLGEELRWRAAHARLISELDEARANDGLDPLLGVWSRTAFMRLVDGLMRYARRHDLPVTLGVIDIVGMGSINERAGYEIGDSVLRHLAEVARYVMRGEDIIGRHGGDSLLLAFIGTPTERAAVAVERLQRALVSDPITDGDGHRIAIRTAAGLAVIHDGDDAERAAGRASETARQALAEGSDLLTGTHAGTRGSEPVLAMPVPHEGTTVGGLYRITHEVGSGGGGSVYRGVDLGLRRPVAIKMLRPELARDAAALERFREEAATLAALRHPNLVQVYAAGVDHGVPYFVMEMVEGETVSQAIERCTREGRKLSLRQVRSTVEHVASALEALHGRGIVHRDVKPANILVDPFRRRTVLVDVGVARRHGDRQEVAGTPLYLPPEGFYAVKPHPSFDIFCFAVTVFEMLALELPWPIEETILQTELTRRTMPPRPLSQYRPELARLDEVFARGLEVEPELRWPSVAELAAAVIAAIDEVDAAQPEALSGVSFEANDAPASTEHVTRGVVFRSLNRVMGPRVASRWRIDLGATRPDLATLLSPTAEPLAWHPTQRLVELLEHAPGTESVAHLGAQLGRATVRATFRRFFPASAVTLTPASTLEALDVIWKQYQSWGKAEVVPSGESATVRLAQVPDDDLLRDFARGMLEQLVTLSGGRDVVAVARTEADRWSFDITWAAGDAQGYESGRSPRSSGSISDSEGTG